MSQNSVLSFEEIAFYYIFGWFILLFAYNLLFIFPIRRKLYFELLREEEKFIENSDASKFEKFIGRGMVKMSRFNAPTITDIFFETLQIIFPFGIMPPSLKFLKENYAELLKPISTYFKLGYAYRFSLFLPVIFFIIIKALKN